ncbi:MAG: hypothetical protein RJA76_689 [Bacteroidota bacterium]|jgi:hypothetical protein
MNRYFLGFTLFFLFFQFGSYLFLEFSVDWDLDAFLYLGSRLVNHQELIFTKDFETKFPLVQYMFSLAYQLGGIGAWKICIFLLSFIGGLMASSILVGTKKNLNISNALLQKETWEYNLLYVVFLYSLPGGGTGHLEPPAATFLFVAIALWYQNIEKNSCFSVTLAGIFLAIAALIRPNYVYLFPIFLGSYFFLKITRKDKFYHFLYFGLGLFVPIFLSFLPYLFVDNGLIALLQGLLLIINFDIQPIGWKGLIFNGMFSFFELQFYFTIQLVLSLILGLYAFGNSTLKIPNVKIYFWVIFLSMFLITYSFSKTHFYFHYVILFLPFFLFTLYLIRDKLNEIKWYRTYAAYLMQAIVIFILPSFVAGKIIYDKIDKKITFNAAINSHGVDPKLLQFLKGQKANGLSFLVIDDAKYHYLLDESRIGDGHPYILNEIMMGKKLRPVGDSYLLKKIQNNTSCEVLKQSSKDLYILSKDHHYFQQVPSCFSDSNRFKKIEVSSLEKYLIWERVNY